jgi:hypothetical protein
VLLVALVLTPAALAANFTFSVVTSSPVTLPTVTLDGDDQSQTFTVTGEIANSGHAGWKIQASAGAPASGSAALPALQATAGSWRCVSGCPSNPLPSGLTYPMTLSSTPQTIYNADDGTGRGTFDITSTFLISYPASATAGTYTSTIVLSGSTGP